MALTYVYFDFDELVQEVRTNVEASLSEMSIEDLQETTDEQDFFPIGDSSFPRYSLRILEGLSQFVPR